MQLQPNRLGVLRRALYSLILRQKIPTTALSKQDKQEWFRAARITLLHRDHLEWKPNENVMEKTELHHYQVRYEWEKILFKKK